MTGFDPPTVDAPTPPPSASSDEFENLTAWVEGFLYEFAPAPKRWCVSWQDHAAAVVPLYDLWRAWEDANAAGGSRPAAWWIYEFRQLISMIGDERGPFAACQNGHQPPKSNTEPWMRNTPTP